MEENRFEKQMQDKMDELKIHPSDTVWGKIAVRIEKKKNRRWLILALFLIGCCILSGGYWLWNVRHQSFSKDKVAVKNNFEKKSNQTFSKENKASQLKIDSVYDLNKKSIDSIHTEREKSNNKNFATLSTHIKEDKKINPGINPSLKFFKNKKINKITAKTAAIVTQAQLAEDQPETKYRKDSSDSIHEKNSIDSLIKKNVEVIIKKQNDTLKQKNAKGIIAKQSNKSKWHAGISLSGGLSGIRNNFFGSSDLIPLAYTNSNVGQAFQNLSSVTKPGIGFTAGVFAEKNITKKIKFCLGINFKSFKTSVKLYDSAGIYSARSSANKYVNHFNFIELPLSLKIKIVNAEKLPLYLQAGVIVSELVSTNALQLNSSTGYYYKDNSLFNKTHIGFHGGLFVSLFSKQKAPVLIGPYVYYNASKIASEELYNKKHFVFTGLNAQIIFGK